MRVAVVPQAVDAPLRTMRRVGPPQTCHHCAHPECERRRREAHVPCGICESRVLPGQTFRPLIVIDGEIVSVVHESCREQEARRV